MGYSDVSAQFNTWFKWGFILNIFIVVLAFLQYAWSFTDSEALQTAVGCFSCPVGCGGLAWFISGHVIRYRHIGDVCSGDYYADAIALDPSAGTLGDAPYQWKSGKFINVYIIIVWSIVAFGCCLMCCLAAAAGNRAGQY